MWGGAETYPPSPSLEGYEGWGGGAGQRKRGGGLATLYRRRYSQMGTLDSESSSRTCHGVPFNSGVVGCIEFRGCRGLIPGVESGATD